MRPESTVSRRLRGWLRAMGLAGVAALGLITLVGSGGGGFSLGFPPCPPDLCGPVLPPAPAVAVQPSHVTALVGSAVVFSASFANVAGTPAVQWRRSSDGGASYSDIPGATDTRLTLPAVNLADDGALFQVVARPASGGILLASGRLVVATVPGVVFADGEFAPADWLTLSADVPQAVGPEHVETQSASGGNPDAYRDMLFRLGLGTGSGAVAYLRRGMSYDPTVQGAVRVIDYAEDCIALAPSDLTFTDSQLLLQQGARNYISAVLTDPCLAADWRPVASRASLTATDFVLLDGPACAAGEACPDFSAQAQPLRFGYRRISFATAGAEVAHGIDNWRVTVWPR